MQNNSVTLSPIPTKLAELAEKRWQCLLEHPDFDCSLEAHNILIQNAFALSDFIFEHASSHPRPLCLGKTYP